MPAEFLEQFKYFYKSCDSHVIIKKIYNIFVSNLMSAPSTVAMATLVSIAWLSLPAIAVASVTVASVLIVKNTTKALKYTGMSTIKLFRS